MNEKNKQETKTTLLKKEEVKMQWFILDAEGKTLGRFASEVAKILRGKHKVSFTPNCDMGDGVIIINAEKVEVSGNKEASKTYLTYTGHIGGQREHSYRQLMDKKPEYIIWRAVKGMMPKSRLGAQQFKKLRVYKGDQHPLAAQKPIKVDI